MLEVLLFNYVFQFYVKYARTEHQTNELLWKGSQKKIVFSTTECKKVGKKWATRPPGVSLCSPESRDIFA